MIGRATVRLGVALATAALLTACGQANMTGAGRAVVPITASETARLSARDVFVAMSRTGFSRQDILDHGPALRNALSMKGGAEVRRDGRVAAIFSIMDGNLYVVSRRGGSYVQELGA
jgi:hypothetical protein